MEEACGVSLPWGQVVRGQSARAGRGSWPPHPPDPQGAHSPSVLPLPGGPPTPTPTPPRSLDASVGRRWGRCWGLAGRPHGSDAGAPWSRSRGSTDSEEEDDDEDEDEDGRARGRPGPPCYPSAGRQPPGA